MDTLFTLFDRLRDYAWDDPYTQFALLVIGVVFLALIIFINSPTVSKNAPAILISLGIFFTFIGITEALFNFDPQNITHTIPELLGGLKLAFISSIGGLFTSLLYRVILFIIKFIKYGWTKIFKKTPDELTAKDFYEQIANINQSIKDGNNTLEKALIGEGEASLSTQIGKLRNDFRDFADKVAKDGTQELVKALEKVIQDFNQKINEQFGENFVRFNEAVENLNKWQEEHREQVEKLTELFQKAQQGIELANQSINEIKESTSEIPEHMASLQTAFDATNNRMQELYEGIGTLAEIRQQAEGTIPAIESHLNQIITELQISLQTQRETISQNLADIQNLQQDVAESMRNASEKMANDIREAAISCEVLMKEASEKMENNINEYIQNVNNQVTAINTQIQKTRNEMMDYVEETMHVAGNNLGSITDHLVEIYRNHHQNIIQQLNEMEQQIRERQPHQL